MFFLLFIDHHPSKPCALWTPFRLMPFLLLSGDQVTRTTVLLVKYSRFDFRPRRSYCMRELICKNL